MNTRRIFEVTLSIILSIGILFEWLGSGVWWNGSQPYNFKNIEFDIFLIVPLIIIALLLIFSLKRTKNHRNVGILFSILAIILTVMYLFWMISITPVLVIIQIILFLIVVILQFDLNTQK